MFDICEVPSGTTILADGGANGPETCTDACSPTEYALTCRGTQSMEEIGNIPDPDPSLKCAVIPIPTPSNELFYCCPCAL
jgi:hypothetical protein